MIRHIPLIRPTPGRRPTAPQPINEICVDIPEGYRFESGKNPSDKNTRFKNIGSRELKKPVANLKVGTGTVQGQTRNGGGRPFHGAAAA